MFDSGFLSLLLPLQVGEGPVLYVFDRVQCLLKCLYGWLPSTRSLMMAKRTRMFGSSWEDSYQIDQKSSNLTPGTGYLLSFNSLWAETMGALACTTLWSILWSPSSHGPPLLFLRSVIFRILYAPYSKLSHFQLNSVISVVIFFCISNLSL